MSVQPYPLPGRRPLLIVSVLLAAVLCVYGQIVHFDFVYWDDDLHVFNNPHLLSASALRFFWRHPYQDLYIPVAYTAYFLLAKIALVSDPAHPISETGALLNPHVFHAAGLVLHALNTLLVFALLRHLVRSDAAAGTGAALFALHPAQAESVAWISELRGLLAATFALSALLLVLREKTTAVVGATGLFLLALLCKPSVVSLPLVAAAVIGMMTRGRFSRLQWGTLAAWALLGLAFVFVTRAAQPVAPALVRPWWERPFVAGDALAFYLGKLVWPWPLGIDYGRTPAHVAHHGWFWLACLVPIVVGLAAWVFRRRAPGFSAGAAVFAAALLPVLGLVPFGFQVYSTVADRYLYLAMLGPALALAWGLTRAPRDIWVVAGGLLFLWAGLSLAQARTWRDSESLFTQAEAVNPASLCAHTNLAVILLRRGDLARALTEEETAAALNPTVALCWNDIGAILDAQGRYSEAVAPLRKALTLDPGDGAADTNLCDALTHLGQYAEAVDRGSRGATLDPIAPMAHTVYGAALEAQGRVADAIRQFQAALRLDPNSAAAKAHLASDQERLYP